MISNSDFEKLWFLYKTEGVPKGISINAFCSSRGVNYNDFNKWYRKMHKSIGMETVEELKKYVRFLYASLQEKDRENLQMKKDMSEIKEELRAANRRADEEAAGRKRLFDKLELFMDEQKSDSDELKVLQRKYETLQGRYDLLCAAHYGGGKTCSDKYSGRKNEGINDGRDDFDGTLVKR